MIGFGGHSFLVLKYLSAAAALDGAAAVPSHAQTILNASPEAIADTVLGDAAGARAVVDKDFFDPIALIAEHGGQKAVHTVKDRDFYEGFAPDGAVGTAGIGDTVARNPIAVGVGDFGGHAPHEVILAFGADATDGIDTGFESFQKSGNIGGVHLEVGIHGDDDLAAGELETGGFTGTFAGVDAVVNNSEPGTAAAERFESRQTGVGTGIVDADDFKGFTGLGQSGFELLHQRAQVILFVVDGDDDGNIQQLIHDEKLTGEIFFNGTHDPMNFLLRESRVHRQGEHMLAGILGLRERAGTLVEVPVGNLKVEGHGVVNAGFDLAFAEERLESISIRDEDDIDVVNGFGLRQDLGDGYLRQIGKGFIVPAGCPAAVLIPLVQMRQADIEEGGLEGIQTGVDSLKLVFVFLRAAVIGEHLHPLHLVRVFGSDSAAIAEAA